MPRAWVALNAVHGLGPVKIKRLLDQYGTAEAVFKELTGDLARLAGIPDEAIAEIRSGATMSLADEQIRMAQACGVHILTLADENYPQILRQIFAPPPVIFIKGDIRVFEKHAIAVVGTRNCSSYGKQATAHIVGGLTAKGIVTVSGLARGIDTCAHGVCLDNGGYTIAVLGSGIDWIYPKENRGLAEKVADRGALVSEFPFKTPPGAYNFPRRNRIISGLSAGVVVIEAGKKSGALITASYALQQGREVFAVPGSIFSEKSEGAFNLIKNGAAPVRSAEDIIESIEVIRHRLPMEEVPATTLPPVELLSEGERIVLEHLSYEPMRVDQIVERTEKVVSELFNILLNLELKGFIRQVAGQQYVRA